MSDTKTKLATIEAAAPGITADLAALSAEFGKAAYVRIRAGGETLEIRRKTTAPIAQNSPERQRAIAAGIGSAGWLKPTHEGVRMR